MKYSRDRAKAVIEVDSIQQPGKPPVIFVRDNGAGFNLKYAEKLFGVFQRFHTDLGIRRNGSRSGHRASDHSKTRGHDLGRGRARSRSHFLFRIANDRSNRDDTQRKGGFETRELSDFISREFR